MAVRSMAETDLQIRDHKVYANAANLATGDTTTPLRLPNFSDKTVHCFGTFSGATVTIQGSNDGTNWATLHKVDLTDLTFSAAGIAQVLENPVYIRASAASGTATDLTVSISCMTTRS